MPRSFAAILSLFLVQGDLALSHPSVDSNHHHRQQDSTSHVQLSDPLPVKTLSAKFRNWTYYNGEFEGFVVPPTAGNFSGQTLTDTPIVFEKSADDNLPADLGKFRMTYLFYNGTKGGNGYETGLATSNDLLHWSFGNGGQNGKSVVVQSVARVVTDHVVAWCALALYFRISGTYLLSKSKQADMLA